MRQNAIQQQKRFLSCMRLEDDASVREVRGVVGNKKKLRPNVGSRYVGPGRDFRARLSKMLGWRERGLLIIFAQLTLWCLRQPR